MFRELRIAIMGVKDIRWFLFRRCVQIKESTL